MAEPRWDRVTLTALLAVLQDGDRVFIAHRMDPHECETVTGGTVRELRSTRCVEVCGDNVVERLALDLDEWPEVWPSDDPAPVLVVTIGGKADLAYMPDRYVTSVVSTIRRGDCYTMKSIVIPDCLTGYSAASGTASDGETLPRPV